MPVPQDLISRRRLIMLAYQMFHERAERFTAESIVSRLRGHPAICGDLAELFEVLADSVAIATTAQPPDPEWPLTEHRRYGRREVLAAVGRWTETMKPDSREGVVRLEDARAELLFVRSTNRRSVSLPRQVTTTTRSVLSSSTGSRKVSRAPTAKAAVATVGSRRMAGDSCSSCA